MDKLFDIVNEINEKGLDIRFLGTGHFWFKDMIERADTLLEVGKVYRARRAEMASSWTEVHLEELRETDMKKVLLYIGLN